jgi:RNA polymerase sigma factor (sigma-70 family)
MGMCRKLACERWNVLSLASELPTTGVGYQNERSCECDTQGERPALPSADGSPTRKRGNPTPFLSRQTTFPSEDPPIERRSERWFASEVHAHDAMLKGYLRRSFPSIRDVDDLVQESYLRVWRRQIARPIEQVSGTVRASVKAFLFQVARRLALDEIRHDRASPIKVVTDFERSSVIDNSSDTHETVCTNQEFQLLLDAIDTLPGRCRAVVVLRKVHGCSPAEAARQLGISEETVHVQMRRGLLRVREFLRDRGVFRQPMTR